MAKKRTLTDPVLGQLYWCGCDDRWEAAVSLDYFRKSGEAIDRLEEEKKAIAKKNAEKSAAQRRKKLEQLAETQPDNPVLQAFRQGYMNELLNELQSEEAPQENENDTRDMAEIIHDADSGALFRKGRFPLAISADPKRRNSPGTSHHAAWKSLMDAGTALWDQLMDTLLEEYVHNREWRRHWWLRTFGPDQSARRFPEITTKAELLKLIRPSSVHMKEARTEKEAADIVIIFDATYCDFGVRVRHGKIALIDGICNLLRPEADQHLPYAPKNDEQSEIFKMCHSFKMEAPVCSEQHASFGTLRFYTGNKRWKGTARLEAFREVRNIAQTRALYRDDPDEVHPTVMVYPWNVTRGDFQLLVSTKGRTPPTEAQSHAFTALLKKQKQYLAAILDAIYCNYGKRFRKCREKLPKESCDDLAPALSNAEGLRELLELHTVEVMAENKEGDVDLMFAFACSWEEPGTGLILYWHNDKVAKIQYGWKSYIPPYYY